MSRVFQGVRPYSTRRFEVGDFAKHIRRVRTFSSERVPNYIWLLVVFPVAVAILAGVLGHSVNLGIKTFLLIECGMAVLSPLLSAVISDGNHTHHHRRKWFSSGEIRPR